MKNSTLVITLTSIAFTITAVVVVGNRLSEQTLTLMTGAVIGGLIGLAVGAPIGWYVKSQRAPERWPASYTPPQSTVILAAPQQQSPTTSSAWQSAYSLTPSYPTSQPNNPRQFTIGGEEIVYHESDAAW